MNILKYSGTSFVFLCTTQNNQFLLFPFLKKIVVKKNFVVVVITKLQLFFLSLPTMYTPTAMTAYSYGTLVIEKRK